MIPNRLNLLILFAFLQILILTFYGVVVEFIPKYRHHCKTVQARHCIDNHFDTLPPTPQYNFHYAFLGIGSMYCFFTDHSISSVMMVFLAGGFAMEWGFLNQGFFYQAFRAIDDYMKTDDRKESNRFNNMRVDTDTFKQIACPPAVAVLISYGAVLGRVNIPQLLVMVFFECMFFGLSYGLNFSRKLLNITQRPSYRQWRNYFNSYFCWLLFFWNGFNVQ